MRYQLLARRLYALAIVSSVISCVLFIAGVTEDSDMAIYAGIAVVVVMAIAAFGSLILTVIEAVVCQISERRRDDKS